MNPENCPKLSFKLDDGRAIKVHAFIWEPGLPQTMEVSSGKSKRKIEIDRNRFKCSDIIRPTKTHVHDWDRLHELPCNSTKFPSSMINVLLSSDPLAADALYSELAVILFTDQVAGLSIEAILERVLHDLDWANLAEDVTEAQNKLWQEVLPENTLH